MSEIQILNNGDSLFDIRRKINENFQLTEREIEDVITDPLSQFGVNEGNVTDGVADLLTLTDGTLSFKVGGEYPNLVMTTGDGVTTEIESVNDLYLQNLADGEYTVVINGQESQITDAEFYSQLLEPENPNNGDVWFNGENATTFTTYSTQIKQMTKQTFGISCMCNIGDTYIAAGSGNTCIVSQDGGQTWTNLSLFAPGFAAKSFIGCVVYDNKFYLLASDRTLTSVDLNLQVVNLPQIPESNNINRFKQINDRYFVTTFQGTILFSDDLQSWSSTVVSNSNAVYDICYVNGSYYCINSLSVVYKSTNLTNWENFATITGGSCLEPYDNDTLLVNDSQQNLQILTLSTKQLKALKLPVHSNINDIKVLNNRGILVVGTSGLCAYSKDLTQLEQIYTGSASLTCIYDKYIAANDGTMLEIEYAGGWSLYPYIPIGELTISGGEVTYFTTYPYNSNGLHEASSSTFGLLRTAAVTDEMDCTCNDAVITPSNLYNIANYRLANTEYKVGDTVGCAYHNNMRLKCTTSGTTSSEALDTSGTLNIGETIIDGTVVWTIESTLNTGQITNCITEVPQRIKVELADGNVVLKAGSVVTIPNGFDDDGTTRKFEHITIESDITAGPIGSSTSSTFWGYGLDTGNLRQSGAIANVRSGDTDSASGADGFWYNTATNKIINYSGGAVVSSSVSLPFAIIHRTSGAWDNIDQVFNGMGYIGSTVWVDKGVKGLVPIGRNEDGTLKNIEARTESVLTYTNTSAVNRYYCFKTPENGVWTSIDYKSDYGLTIGTQNSSWYYSEVDNCWLYNGQRLDWIDFAYATLNESSPFDITSFTPKTAINLSNAVHATGDEEIRGVKRFIHNSWGQIIVKGSDMDITTTPSSTKHIGIDFRDRQEARLGFIGISQDVNNNRTIVFQHQNSSKFYFDGAVTIREKFGTEIAIATNWTATASGVVYVRGYSDSTGNKAEVYFDGFIVYNNYQSGSNANNHNIGACIPIHQGQKVTISGKVETLVFRPYVSI